MVIKMGLEKLFARIIWKNLPARETAVNEANLNRIETALDTIDDRVIEMDTTKLNIETANSMLRSLEIDKKTGIIRARQLDGTVYEWDLNLEKIPAKLSLTADAVLIMETDDGEAYEADLKGLIDTYIFDDSDTLAFSQTQQEDGKHVTAEVKKGSITGEHLNPDYLAGIERSEANAQGQAELAAEHAALAKRWAVGDKVNYPESATDNAQYFAEQAKAAAELAKSTVDLNLPTFDIDIGTGCLMGTYDKPFNFDIDENGCLMLDMTGE